MLPGRYGTGAEGHRRGRMAPRDPQPQSLDTTFASIPPATISHNMQLPPSSTEYPHIVTQIVTHTDTHTHTHNTDTHTTHTHTTHTHTHCPTLPIVAGS